MKTTLAILIAGLFLLATPMLALAWGDDSHGKGPEHSRSWNHDRYCEQRDFRGQRFESHRHYPAKKHFVRHQRRPQLIARPAPRYERRVYASAPLVFLPPRVVLHFGW